jgi:hypothetical protein
MRNPAHVPIQTWRGWNPNDLFEGWFSALGRFKTLIGAMGLVLGSWLISPCLVPLVFVVSQDHFGGHYRKEMAAHVMMLWKYKPLNQDDDL